MRRWLSSARTSIRSSFAGVDPIGKKLLVDGVQYEVIGVAKAKGSVFGQSQDKFVADPDLLLLQDVWPEPANATWRLFAKAADSTHLEEAKDEVRMLLRSYRHLTPQGRRHFQHFRFRYPHQCLAESDRRHRRHGLGRGFGVPGGGRNRHHEHHAGGGDGAYARNRHSQIVGRAAAATS